MKIHARTELEGQQGGGERIDEYFLSVSGSFGKIILGGTGGAPVKMLTGFLGSWATGVGDTLAFDSDDWVGSAAGNFYALQHSRLDTGDANKATYISPKFGGFQIGLTYSPNMVNDDSGSRVNAETGHHDGIEGAVSYTGKFGDVGFGVGAGMTAYQGANEKVMKDGKDTLADKDMSDWLVAGRIDFGGGFRIAVAHKQVTNDNKATQGQLTDVGVRYIMGSNSFSLVGAYGEMDQGGASYSAVMGSYARALGPGVKAHVKSGPEPVRQREEGRRERGTRRHRAHHRPQGGVLADAFLPFHGNDSGALRPPLFISMLAICAANPILGYWSTAIS